jgi:hypothetical protein
MDDISMIGHPARFFRARTEIELFIIGPSPATGAVGATGTLWHYIRWANVPLF